MDTNFNQGWRAADFDDYGNSEPSNFSWNTLLFAVAITLIAVNWGFLRPAAKQLTSMKEQITTLQTTVNKLSNEYGSAHNTLSLMDVLSEQGRLSNEAAESLARIADFQDRVLDEASQLQISHQCLSRLADLRQGVEEHRQLVEATVTAIDQSKRIQDQVASLAIGAAEAEAAIQRIDSLRTNMADGAKRLDQVNPVLAQIDSINEKLTGMAPDLRQAESIADDMVDLNCRLTAEASTVATAASTLDGIIEMKQTISAESNDLPKTQVAVQQLVDLKDDVLAEAENIPAAIESLEQTIDLHDQFARAAQSFEQIRRWMGDVILLEPTIQRAMSTLEPLADLGSLRRMTREELKQAADYVRRVRSDQAVNVPAVARKPNVIEIK